MLSKIILSLLLLVFVTPTIEAGELDFVSSSGERKFTGEAYVDSKRVPRQPIKLKSLPSSQYVVRTERLTGQLSVVTREDGEILSCFSPAPKKFGFSGTIVAKFKSDGLKFKCMSGFNAVTELAKEKKISPLYLSKRICESCQTQFDRPANQRNVERLLGQREPAQQNTHRWVVSDRTQLALSVFKSDEVDLLDDDWPDDEFEIDWRYDIDGDGDIELEEIDVIGVTMGDIPRCTAILNRNLAACNEIPGFPPPLRLARVLCSLGALSLYWACIAAG